MHCVFVFWDVDFLNFRLEDPVGSLPCYEVRFSPNAVEVIERFYSSREPGTQALPWETFYETPEEAKRFITQVGSFEPVLFWLYPTTLQTNHIENHRQSTYKNEVSASIPDTFLFLLSSNLFICSQFIIAFMFFFPFPTGVEPWYSLSLPNLFCGVHLCLSHSLCRRFCGDICSNLPGVAWRALRWHCLYWQHRSCNVPWLWRLGQFVILPLSSVVTF